MSTNPKQTYNFNNVFLIGPMGAGKTTIGQQLARALHYTFYDADHEVEARSGVHISWIFDVEGEAGFRRREKDVIDDLTQKHHIVLATGGGAILDPDSRKHLASRGYVIYLKTSLETQYKRTSYNKNRPLLQRDNRLEIIQKLQEERSPLYEEIAHVSFESDLSHTSNLVKKIVNHLKLL